MNTTFKDLAEAVAALVGIVPDPFPRDKAGLSLDQEVGIVELHRGDTWELKAFPVRKRIGDTEVKMLSYNGSIPGPVIKAPQGAEVMINFTNLLDLETTVHWHGLRLDNRWDGVPQGAHGGMQAPIPTRGSYTYHLRFPDAGVFWYHPHMREDYTQEMGLYGNIIVVPSDPSYWAPTNREYALILDDILIERGAVAAFSRSTANRIAMGRYGNVMLVNGETSGRLTACQGEVVRLYLTNTANVRPFRVAIPGADMKLVGSDGGRIEREELVTEVVLAPSERAIVDVLFEATGQYALEHRSSDRTYTLTTIAVSAEQAQPSYAQEFHHLRENPEFKATRARLAEELERAPDKVLSLVGEMPGMRHDGHGHQMDPIEWEDTMARHNRMTSPRNMLWKMVDATTGEANHAINWSFALGQRAKIRIVNEPHSDHPMQHSVHFHGQRFLVLARDGVPNHNLAWKDTALARTGEIVDILLDCSNPGRWMAHCHIAEHLESGMMFSFDVGQEPATDHRHG